MYQRHPLPDPDLAPDIYADVTAKRAFAWAIDLVITVILTAIAVPFTLFIGLLFLPFLWLLVSLAYRTATIARSGATLGMRLVSIEIRSLDGRRLDLGLAAAHSAIYTVGFGIFPLQLLSIVLMLSGPRSRGFGDHVLGTVAINRVTRY